MIPLKYLTQEAKEQGLPENKHRAIIREYLQNIILHSIYKTRNGKKLYFMGGTALRYCYQLPRFSEDLDFNTKKLTHKEIRNITQEATRNLQLEGFKTETQYTQRKTLYTAEINLPQIMQQYNITDQRGVDLMIKLEVNKPHWDLETKQHIISLYGYNYTPTVMTESSMITEKLCALLNRKRGRDIYDLMFMLKKKFPFNKKILAANNLPPQPKQLIIQRLKNLGEKELKRLANQVQPFLFREEDTEPIIKAQQYAQKHLKNY